jgi:hypothetical protein
VIVKTMASPGEGTELVPRGEGAKKFGKFRVFRAAQVDLSIGACGASEP